MRLSELLAPAVAEERAAAAEAAAMATRLEMEALSAQQLSPEAAEAVAQQRVEELVKLFYFARLFGCLDSANQVDSAELERTTALLWDAHHGAWQQPPVGGLSERELDGLVLLSRELTSRPAGAAGVISHDAAMARCTQLACAYAAGVELSGSAAAVRGCVAQLLASGFTAQVPTLQPVRMD